MAYLPDKTQPRAVRLAQAIDTLMEMKLDRLRAQDQLTTCARYEEALRGGTIESKPEERDLDLLYLAAEAVLSAWSGTENHLRCPSEALTAAIGKLGEVMQRMQR